MSASVIDTETNALPDLKRSADAEGQPRLAQLSMILLNVLGEIEGEQNFYVKPDGWSMSPETTAINGLTDEFLHEHGIPVRDVLEAYSQAILSGRFIIAFNAQFDCKIMRGELRRAGLHDLFEQTRNVCVMRKSGGIITALRPIKDKVTKEIIGHKETNNWPSLERCRDVLGLPHEGAHRGMKDAFDALAVYRHLLTRGVDLTPEVHHHAHVEEIRANG